MSDRVAQLLAQANRQISQLLELLSTQEPEILSRPCPGREKLGDGTIGATAQHTARVYQQLAGFIQASRSGQTPRSASVHGHSQPMHGPDETERPELHELLQHLSRAASALTFLPGLADEELDNVPVAGSFRFCDGRRNLEQVVVNVLNHQAHHIDALEAAVS